MTRVGFACGVAALAVFWARPSAAQESSVEPQPITVAGASTYVYKSVQGVDLRLHVFEPAGHNASEPRPAIVLFFGGGWTTGTIQQFVPQSTHLARRGMVAIVADYRVFRRHGTTPFDAIADARSAIRWVRANAAKLGIDPDRIAAGGGSAGGHIAAAAALVDRTDEPGEDASVSPRPDALVLFNPVVDTSPERAPARSNLETRFEGRGQDASPRHHLARGLPPTLILHGKADTTVPYGEVEGFCEEATSRGARCHLVGYDEAGHGFFNPQNTNGRWHHETLLEADRFLTTLGYLPNLSPAERAR